MTKPILIGVILLVSACNPQPCTEQPDETLYPARDLGELFHDVQLSRTFSDSKTFADYIPRCDPSVILEEYRKQKNSAEIPDLKIFVEKYFDKFPEPSAQDGNMASRPMEEYLKAQWDNLIREDDTSRHAGSLLSLPYPYVVPGGRFREIYYWDSYFTMLGLAETEKNSLVENMVDNFAFLIETYGHIPNGNRSYYLSRSQPPFFSSMVRLLGNITSDNAMMKYLPLLEREYRFWMNGAEELSSAQNQNRRVVLLDSVILNRYWDDLPEPRPESYKEDFELAEELPETEKELLYRNLKAGAESGWDYSSRWFSDRENLSTIKVTDILPVDLNCLMYHLESTIAYLYEIKGEMQQWAHYSAVANTRRRAINKYFWNEEKGYYADYDLESNRVAESLTAATTAPLFFGIADKEKATQVSEAVEEYLLLGGGIVTTMQHTGQQWDFPNGWAPLQWMAIEGFLRYENEELAKKIASRWLNLNRKVYNNTGKMMEKYDVADTTLEAGGGEYPTQDGFGWTNGVALKIMEVFPELREEIAAEKNDSRVN